MVQHPNKLTLSPPCASMDRARWPLKTALNQTASV
jgi:hypothetical protein